MRSTRIPHSVDLLLEKAWNKLSSAEKTKLAEDVLSVSTHFQEADGPQTPWEKFHQAYLFYFLPLNLARAKALFESLEPLMTPLTEELFDLGAGYGNLTLLKEEFPDFLKGKITSIEHQPPPHSENLPTPPPSLKKLPFSLPASSVGFFSYSWVEMQTSLEQLEKFDTLIFMEPSTSVVARKIMALRKDLIGRGFQALAPCTHQKDCPLLLHSRTDWCHDRVYFEASPWFLELESLLPMKNHSLTYTYLVVSRSRPALAQDWTRVIGDTLKEKGKSRQAICFDDERRFLSWLKRDFEEIPVIDHGRLIKIENALEKNAELRVRPLTHIVEFSRDRKAETPG